MKRNLYETVPLTNVDKLTLHIDYIEFVILRRLIYPGLCIHANVFKHYHRIKML